MAKQTNSKKKSAPDASTEDRILEAARKVFTQKGYAATRTRDIAAEAEINLALLNYYFRSKEKLFERVMRETMGQFVMGIMEILNDKHTSLEEKLGLFADQYIDLMIRQPDLPLFVLSEIRSNPTRLAETFGIRKYLLKSVFIKQLQEAVAGSKKGKVNPMHIFINIMGMLVFPFVGRPLLKEVGDMKDDAFDDLMRERKKLIPIWVKAIIKGS